MSNLIALQRLRKLLPTFNRRLVSTSKKNNETVDVAASATNVCKTTTKKEHKNWIYYGFDISNKEEDRNAMHSAMFVTITLCMVVGAYFFAYLPDIALKDWSVREGFLELRRREANGLPLIDPNLIDPNKINLPTDEELGNTPIII